ncbi:MAG: hypothetical protein IT436_13430 [Phycisphaerales bacterium]|nr:hypothetical protein [Phycisphaerales bacterium]
MSTRIYRFTFEKGPKMTDIEEVLELAVLAASCLHGSAAVRVNAGYASDAHARAIVLDGSTVAGRDVILLFTGLSAEQFGGSAFKVDRVAAPARRAG